jgi:hypothetical protein
VLQVRNLWLVTQCKSLEDAEPVWLLRWLLRRYFQWRGFACRSHCGKCNGDCYASIEYRGAFDNEPEARWAASCKGGAYRPIPFNAALPEETVQYIAGDVPTSESSPWYRRGVMLPFVAIERSQFERLEAKTQQTLDCAEGKCEPKAV